jgi:hypothetical protein
MPILGVIVMDATRERTTDTPVRVEAGYASMIELQRFTVNTICAKLWNDMLAQSKVRYCITVTYNGRKVDVEEYRKLEDTYLYTLEKKKLDVIS